MERIYRPVFYHIIGTFYILIWTFPLWMRESIQLDNVFLWFSNYFQMTFRRSSRSSERVPFSMEVSLLSLYLSPEIVEKKQCPDDETTCNNFRVVGKCWVAEKTILPVWFDKKENPRLWHKWICESSDTSLALEAISVVAGLQESFSSKSQVPRFQRLLHSTFIYAIETIAIQRIL